MKKELCNTFTTHLQKGKKMDELVSRIKVLAYF